MRNRLLISGSIVAVSLGMAHRHVSAAESVFPDFDLRVDCPARIEAKAGTTVRFPAAAVLRTSPGEADSKEGARAWSIGLRVGRTSRIMSPSTEGTAADLAPKGYLLPDGFVLAKETTGDGNEGVISAVILSFSAPAFLPPDGEATLLRFEVETQAPATGSTDVAIWFADGLQGDGQQVKNVITFGEAFSRRDDGSQDDNDSDGYENGRTTVAAASTFVRGDASGDGVVGLADAVLILDHLFRGGGPSGCPRAADADASNSVNLSDTVFILVHLFGGGPPPAPPYPNCGDSGPNEDKLSCDDGGSCK